MKTRMTLLSRLCMLICTVLVPLSLLAPGFASGFALDVPEQTRKFDLPPHKHYDQVLHEVFVDLTIIGVVVALITIYFLIAYRRKSPDAVGKQPKLSMQATIGWLIIPSALFLADDLFLFAKAWDLNDNVRKVPANAYEIKVTGALWSWSYEYPNGVSTINELVVPIGKPILLRMTSIDVIHSHYLNKYRVTEDVVPGRISYQWFLPDEKGESVVTCREYCGMMHSGMYGKVNVVSQSDFDRWLQEQAAAAALSQPTPVANAVLEETKTGGDG